MVLSAVAVATAVEDKPLAVAVPEFDFRLSTLCKSFAINDLEKLSHSSNFSQSVRSLPGSNGFGLATPH
jgi:hypothetical protein